MAPQTLLGEQLGLAAAPHSTLENPVALARTSVEPALVARTRVVVVVAQVTSECQEQVDLVL